MAIALDRYTANEASLGTRPKTISRDVAERAEVLVVQLVALLTTLGDEVSASDSFRVRLAKAHALSTLDELSEVLRHLPDPPG